MIPFSEDMIIYDTVDVFKEKFLTSKIKFSSKKIKNCVPLKEVINLHNVDGIRDIGQVKVMVKKIKSGKDIFNTDGLPNIKLVKTKDEKWVLFDGHHSMLAYMLSGKKYLSEIPHLVVEDEKNEFVTDKEIFVFFGDHSSKLKDKNWRNFVINWQAPKERQLQKRIQKNMGELLDVLMIKITQ